MFGAEWAGVDVGGRTKGFHVALLDGDLAVELVRAGSVEQCMEVLVEHRVRVVAIDAPAAWAPDGERSRPCERAFAAAAVCGIRFTPDVHAAASRADGYYEWIEHGLELWAACQARGLRVHECFPTAAWTAWLGPRGSRSRAQWTGEGIQRLGRDGVTGVGRARNQDERDAIAAALVARQLDTQPDTVDRYGELVVPRPGTWPVRPILAEAGRLAPGTSAPSKGEDTIVLARGDGFTVEQILGGRLPGPTAYEQDHDEWVVVLEGAAVVEVADRTHRLGPGDWLLLPAGVAHVLVEAEPATSWLAVRGSARRG